MNVTGAIISAIGLFLIGFVSGVVLEHNFCRMAINTLLDGLQTLLRGMDDED